MKKIFSSVMLFAAAAMAFVSCQKQESFQPEDSKEYMLTFTSEKPAFSDETKTEWTGETVQWSQGDKIAVAYTVNGNWQNAAGDASGNAKLYKSDDLKSAADVAQFNVSTHFKGTVEGVHVFYGVYPAPSSTDFPNAPVATLVVAPSQNPKADSFDPNGDMMIGVSGNYESRPEENELISLKWERLVAHAVITLKNISGLVVGENIEKITLTAQDDANLVGQQKINLITKEIVKDNNEANVLKLSANNLSVTDGTVSFWACVLPETVTSLNVEVETDRAIYTRNIPSCNLSFKKNARNTLAVKMDKAERVEKVIAEDEVTDVLNRALTGVTNTSYASWEDKTSVSTAVYAGQSAGGNESIQLRSTNNNSGIITTASGGFVTSVSVIWNANTANGRTLNVYGKSSAYADPAELYDNSKCGTLLGTIVCGTSTELVVDGKYEYIGLRSVSGAMYIQEIHVTWSTESDAPDIPEMPAPSIDVQEALQLSADASTGTIDFTYENLEDIEVSVDYDWLYVAFENDPADGNGSISYVVDANEGAARTASIRINGNDLNGDLFETFITVTQAAGASVESPVEISIRDFLAIAESSDNVTYTVTGTIVSITDLSASFGNATLTIADDSGNELLVYRMKPGDGNKIEELGLNVGDVLTVTGNWAVYNDAVQMSNGVYVSHVDGEEPEESVKTVSVSEFNAAPVSAATLYRVVGRIVSITEISASYNNANLTISDGSNDLYLYRMKPSGSDKIADLGLTVGDELTVVGNRGYYNGAIQMTNSYCESHRNACETPVITCSNNVVTIVSATENVAIMYSIDAAEYKAYNTPISITGDCEIKAYATRDGYLDSFIAVEQCLATGAGVVSESETLDLTKGYSNATDVPAKNGTVASVSFNKGTNSNAPKWYSTGTAVRVYGGGYFTVSANNNKITKIVVTYNMQGSNAISVDSGTVEDDGAKSTWIGEATSVKFTVGGTTGHRRVQKIEVTYEY